MYRTPLIQKEPAISTTQILQAYQISFEDYLLAQGLNFAKENDLYKISNQKSQPAIFTKFNATNGNKIVEQLYKDILSVDADRPINSIFELTKTDICLLPLISWHKNIDNSNITDFKYFYKKVLGGIKK